MLTKLITQVLKTLYSGKTEQIYAKMQPTLESLSEQRKRLDRTIEEFNQNLFDPKTILAFKEVGVDVATWPTLSIRGKVNRQNNLLFKNNSKQLL